jgi:hypothetical protein
MCSVRVLLNGSDMALACPGEMAVTQEQLGFLQQEDYTCRDGSGQQVWVVYGRVAGLSVVFCVGLRGFSKLCWQLPAAAAPAAHLRLSALLHKCYLGRLLQHVDTWNAVSQEQLGFLQQEDYTCRDGSGQQVWLVCGRVVWLSVVFCVGLRGLSKLCWQLPAAHLCLGALYNCCLPRLLPHVDAWNAMTQQQGWACCSWTTTHAGTAAGSRCRLLAAELTMCMHEFVVLVG